MTVDSNDALKQISADLSMLFLLTGCICDTNTFLPISHIH